MDQGTGAEGRHFLRHFRRPHLCGGTADRRARANRLRHPVHAARYRRALHDDASLRRNRSRDGRGRDRPLPLHRRLPVRRRIACSRQEPGMDALRNRGIAPAEETLDPADWTDVEDLSHRIMDDAIAYLRGVRDRPVWREMPPEVRAFFEAPLPRAPMPLSAVYREVAENLMPYPMGNVHPRF